MDKTETRAVEQTNVDSPEWDVVELPMPQLREIAGGQSSAAILD